MVNEENVNVQKDGSAQAAEAEKKKGATGLGKFKDVNALLEAYSALQAEFTRRSQRLRALEKAAENSVREGDAEKVESEDTQQSEEEAESADAVTAQATEEPREREPADAVIEKAALSNEELLAAVNENDEVRLQVIGEYLASIKRSGAPVVTIGTGSPAVSKIKAKSVADAGDLALKLFKNGNGA